MGAKGSKGGVEAVRTNGTYAITTFAECGTGGGNAVGFGFEVDMFFDESPIDIGQTMGDAGGDIDQKSAGSAIAGEVQQPLELMAYFTILRDHRWEVLGCPPLYLQGIEDGLLHAHLD